MARRRSSIATLVVATLVTVTTVLVGALGALSILAEQERQRAALHHDLRAVTEQLALDLALPLWNFDEPQLDHLVESAMARHDVAGIVVQHPDAAAPGGVHVEARVRDEAWRSRRSDRAPQGAGLLVERRPVLHASTPIGSVEVTVTPRFMEARLRARLSRLALEILALDVLLVVSLSLLLWRLVIRPLKAVERLAQGAALRGPEGPVRLRGELESLRGSIERTFAELDARYGALRRNEAMLAGILNSVPQSIFWKDRQSVYLGCNDVFAREVGLPGSAAVVGKTDFDLPFPREDAEAYRLDDQQVLGSGEPKRHILERMVRGDGQVRIVETTKVQLRDGQDAVYGVLGVFEDVTERENAGAARKELEEQLRQSQKMEAIGTLAAGIAHDFNNILSAILGNAELAMLEVGPQHPAATSLAEIDRASARARDLVRQIVGFSRPHAATAEPVDIARLLAEVVRLMRSTIPSGVELVTRADVAQALWVRADPTQLHQVLMNLYTNAWQAMAGAPGRIDVTLAPCTLTEPSALALPAGEYVCLTVSDTGPGMAPGIRDRVFEPFFTTKPRSEGTGLGLSTVQGIVRSLQGAITVESAQGVGSTFRVYLPAVAAPSKPSAPPPAPAAQAATSQPRRSQRVIYVDDEEALVFLVTRQLELEGYQIQGYTSAEEALAAVERAPDAFDVLVTDYNMPRMSGLELARRVLELRAGARVVLTSGYIAPEMQAASDALGVKWLVYKPSGVRELCATIERIATAPDGA